MNEICWQVQDCWKEQGCDSKKKTQKLYFYQRLKYLLCSPLSGPHLPFWSAMAPSSAPGWGAEWGHKLQDVRATAEAQCNGRALGTPAFAGELLVEHKYIICTGSESFL